jgi:hypothetical protein
VMPSRCCTCKVSPHTKIRSRSPSWSGSRGRARTGDRRCRVRVRARGRLGPTSSEGVLGSSSCSLGGCCGGQGWPCAQQQALVEFSLFSSLESVRELQPYTVDAARQSWRLQAAHGMGSLLTDLCTCACQQCGACTVFVAGSWMFWMGLPDGLRRSADLLGRDGTL